MLVRHPSLIEERQKYANNDPAERRMAAKWQYDSGMAEYHFSAALDRLDPDASPEARLEPSVLALAIDPEFAPALLTVGSIEYQLGRLDDAMELFLKLTDLEDQDDLAEIIDKAGDFLIDQKDYKHGMKLYQTATERRPTTAIFWGGLAYCLNRLGQGQEALLAARQAVELEPESACFQSDLGWLLVELEQFSEARSVLEKAVELAPPDYNRPRANLKRLQELEARARPSQKPRTSKRTRAPKSEGASQTTLLLDL